METLESNINHLPLDIALEIAFSLSDKDVCALGSCSRHWRVICGSDLIWVSRSKKRWPSLFTHPTQALDQLRNPDPLITDWKGFYAKRHKEIAVTVASVASVEYFNGPKLADMYNLVASVQFGFNDVEQFLFDPERDERLLFFFISIGFHYSTRCLHLPHKLVKEAISRKTGEDGVQTMNRMLKLKIVDLLKFYSKSPSNTSKNLAVSDSDPLFARRDFQNSAKL